MSDPFDSSALFAEFNRPRESTDKILLGKLKDRSPRSGCGSFTNGITKDSSDGGGPAPANPSSPSAADSDSRDGSSAEDDSENENENQIDGDKPVEVGRDDAGVLYRPGRKERLVGKRLLQHAKYADGGSDVGDNKVYDDEAQRLLRQNMNLKKCARLIDPTKHILPTDDDEGPAIQVLYMNHKIARKYRGEIDRFVSDLIARDEEQNDHMKDVRLRPHHVCLAEGANDISDQDTHIRQHRTSTVIGSCRFYREFTVDIMGWPLVDFIPALTDGWEIPRYQQQFTKALPVDGESGDEGAAASSSKKQKASCFNCGGNHRLDKCEEQRDFQRIAENRRKFKSTMPAQQFSLNKGTCLDLNPRFSKFKAGMISDELRKALGVRPQQVPVFFFKMRQLGYPPGHLAACQVETSGIAMFDKHGRAMRKGTTGNNEDNALEDGEMDDEDEETDLYDTSKLIEFPGFNVPLPDGYIDESRALGYPPMMPHHAKEFMEKALPTAQGVKRHRSNTERGPGSAKRQKLTTPPDDMDLDTGAESEGPTRGLSRSSSTTSFTTQESGAETPTLEDLEERRLLLQQMVAEAEGDSQDSQDSTSFVGQSDQRSSRGRTKFIPPLPPGTPDPSSGPSGSSTPISTAPPLPAGPPPETPPRPSLPVGTPPVTPISDSKTGTPLESSTPVGDPFSTPVEGTSLSFLNSSGSASLSRTLSTPVSKVMKEPLPDVEKFQSGVQGHIPYENLPNATGTYDKMKDIIANIRLLRKSLTS